MRNTLVIFCLLLLMSGEHGYSSTKKRRSNFLTSFCLSALSCVACTASPELAPSGLPSPYRVQGMKRLKVPVLDNTFFEFLNNRFFDGFLKRAQDEKLTQKKILTDYANFKSYMQARQGDYSVWDEKDSAALLSHKISLEELRDRKIEEIVRRTTLYKNVDDEALYKLKKEIQLEALKRLEPVRRLFSKGDVDLSDLRQRLKDLKPFYQLPEVYRTLSSIVGDLVESGELNLADEIEKSRVTIATSYPDQEYLVEEVQAVRRLSERNREYVLNILPGRSPLSPEVNLSLASTLEKDLVSRGYSVFRVIHLKNFTFLISAKGYQVLGVDEKRFERALNEDDRNALDSLVLGHSTTLLANIASDFGLTQRELNERIEIFKREAPENRLEKAIGSEIIEQIRSDGFIKLSGDWKLPESIRKNSYSLVFRKGALLTWGWDEIRNRGWIGKIQGTTDNFGIWVHAAYNQPTYQMSSVSDDSPYLFLLSNRGKLVGLSFSPDRAVIFADQENKGLEEQTGVSKAGDGFCFWRGRDLSIYEKDLRKKEFVLEEKISWVEPVDSDGSFLVSMTSGGQYKFIFRDQQWIKEKQVEIVKPKIKKEYWGASYLLDRGKELIVYTDGRLELDGKSSKVDLRAGEKIHTSVLGEYGTIYLGTTQGRVLHFCFKF
ncbi:MAG: hypothetical protein AB7F43_01740 [Bacteriovoracia bacterium]